MQCHQLSVDVREAYLVVIYQTDFSNSAARQHFHHITAHTAHAKNHDMRAAQPFQGSGAKEHFGSGKLIFHILFLYSVCKVSHFIPFFNYLCPWV